MNWRVELSNVVERQLKRFPRDIQRRIEQAIDDLEVDPLRGDVILLKGQRWQGRYRKRIGRYRIIFMLHYKEHMVRVSAILLRNENTYQ